MGWTALLDANAVSPLTPVRDGPIAGALPTRLHTIQLRSMDKRVLMVISPCGISLNEISLARRHARP